MALYRSKRNLGTAVSSLKVLNLAAVYIPFTLLRCSCPQVFFQILQVRDSGGSLHREPLGVLHCSMVNTVIMFSCAIAFTGRKGLTEMVLMTVQSTRLVNVVVSCMIDSSNLEGV